ncbi:MAG: efflux RND transporter permease subunit [bacterium]
MFTKIFISHGCCAGHINALRRKGLAILDAVIQGARDRVRPILMTTATTVFGLLPLILFIRSGESNLVCAFLGDHRLAADLDFAGFGGGSGGVLWLLFLEYPAISSYLYYHRIERATL